MAPGLMSPPTSHVACSYGCTRASVLEKGGAPVLVLGCPRLLRCPTSAPGWLFDLCSRSSPSPPAGSGGHIGLTSPSRHSLSFSGPEGDRGLRGARVLAEAVGPAASWGHWYWSPNQGDQKAHGDSWACEEAGPDGRWSSLRGDLRNFGGQAGFFTLSAPAARSEVCVWRPG